MRVSYLFFAFSLCAAHARAETPAVSTPPPITYTVLARKAVRVGDHTITYNRVLPPVLPVHVSAAVARVLTAKEQAIAARQERKAYAQISLNADVRATPTGPVSILTWRHEGKFFRAYTNADFRLLTVVTHIETTDTLYSWFGIVSGLDSAVNGLSGSDAAEANNDLPAGLAFASGFSEYVVDATDAELAAAPATAFIGVEVLLAYHDANKAALTQTFAVREAANAERLRQLRDHPPKRPDTVINFWKIPSGSAMPSGSATVSTQTTEGAP